MFEHAGVTLRGAPEDLWSRALALGAAHTRDRPRPGDIAFFDNTFDRDHDGRVDDPLTHVAVVLSVDAAGTILLAHGGSSRGRSTFVMNLSAPGLVRDDAGHKLNDNLRPPRSSDPPGTRYLASELFHGFATVRPEQASAWAAPHEG